MERGRSSVGWAAFLVVGGGPHWGTCFDGSWVQKNHSGGRPREPLPTTYTQ